MVEDTCDNCGTSYERPETDFSGYCNSCSPQGPYHTSIGMAGGHITLTDWEHELLGTADQQQESNHPELPQDRANHPNRVANIDIESLMSEPPGGSYSQSDQSHVEEKRKKDIEARKSIGNTESGNENGPMRLGPRVVKEKPSRRDRNQHKNPGA